jgi:hypothetical protein
MPLPALRPWRIATRSSSAAIPSTLHYLTSAPRVVVLERDKEPIEVAAIE